MEGEGEADVKSTGYQRLERAFASCGLEMWELYGHGPPKRTNKAADTSNEDESEVSGIALPASSAASFMWTAEHAKWAMQNPPPLTPLIGDMTVTDWRKREKGKGKGKAQLLSSPSV